MPKLHRIHYMLDSLHRAAFGMLALVAITFYGVFSHTTDAMAQSSLSPVPLISKEKPVDWWFVFKFNTAAFPGCGGGATRQCIFGGDPQQYKFGQQYVVANSAHPSLEIGSECAGDSTADPIGATFNQVYNGAFHYVIWNDQFYDDPRIEGCTKECGSPWGHSKGVLAWDDGGAGFVLQVSTPSWPGSGSTLHERKDGNTLGCVNDDNVLVSQHFFALKLTHEDTVKVLGGLANASVVTDPANSQIVSNGGPEDIRQLVETLGKKSNNDKPSKETLSSGVELISKPSALHVPPWQMVSAMLGGVPLRTATWWAKPEIPTTTPSSEIGCWETSLGKPGAVEIAISGQWAGKTFGLTGGMGPNFNHAKMGVAQSGPHPYTIFGDMNQQGTLSGTCGSSQNGRGGLFYVLENAALSATVNDLIRGSTAPESP
jgi:Deoxyribonuclease II